VNEVGEAMNHVMPGSMMDAASIEDVNPRAQKRDPNACKTASTQQLVDHHSQRFKSCFPYGIWSNLLSNGALQTFKLFARQYSLPLLALTAHAAKP
jgi:hypothetical protein